MYSGFHPFAGPGRFFTEGEKAVWRNCSVWNRELNDPEWSTLPGPADWWPDDINSIGFYTPNDSYAKGFYDAYKMIHKKEPPTDGSYERVYPSDTELKLVPPDLPHEAGGNDFLDQLWA